MKRLEVKEQSGRGEKGVERIWVVEETWKMVGAENLLDSEHIFLEDNMYISYANHQKSISSRLILYFNLHYLFFFSLL